MFNQEQINFIKSIGLEFDFNNLSDDDIIQIEDGVATELQISGFDENYNITNIGKMCESILDDLSLITFSAEQIKERLLEFCTLMTFEYHGLHCSIDPFNPKLFHINCNGDEQDVDSIEKVMGSPLFDGACLNDIVNEIYILDW